MPSLKFAINIVIIPMQVSKNKVVSFHYRLFNEIGEELESTLDSDPTVILIGARNTFIGLEKALMGKNIGDKVKATLEPYEAYGVRKDNQQQRVPAKYLKQEGKLSPGQAVQLNSENGVRVVTVVKVGKFSIDVDLNHPLAGQRISFDIEIKDIREANDEEIAHGHAHGKGGHQH